MANSKTRPTTRMLAMLLALFTFLGVIGTSSRHILRVTELASDEYVPQAARTLTVVADRTATVTSLTESVAAVNRWRLFLFGGCSRSHKVGNIVEGDILTEKIAACGRFLHNLGV